MFNGNVIYILNSKSNSVNKPNIFYEYSEYIRSFKYCI